MLSPSPFPGASAAKKEHSMNEPKGSSPPLPNSRCSILAALSIFLGSFSLLFFGLGLALVFVAYRTGRADLSLLPVFIWLVGAVEGGVAAVAGARGRREIVTSGGTLTGAGLARAGQVMGCASVLLILVALALPNFVKARETASQNSLVNNLRQIESAKDQWHLEHKKAIGDLPTESEIAPYLKNNQMPRPIVGETYVINPIGTPAHAVTPVPYG